MITLLMPTRSRFYEASNTISSFFEMAKNKDNIEFIIRCDSDDKEFLLKLTELPYFERIKVIIGNRYSGYYDLHLFYNEMLKLSTGNFIMPINDDLICETKNYDELILSKSVDDIKIYTGINKGNYQGWYFPIINKKILDEIGHLSKCVFYDGYLYFSLKELGIYEDINLKFTHYQLKDKLSEDKDVVLKTINSGDKKHLDYFKNDMDANKIKIKNILKKNNE